MPDTVDSDFDTESSEEEREQEIIGQQLDKEIEREERQVKISRLDCHWIAIYGLIWCKRHDEHLLPFLFENSPLRSSSRLLPAKTMQSHARNVLENLQQKL